MQFLKEKAARTRLFSSLQIFCLVCVAFGFAACQASSSASRYSQNSAEACIRTEDEESERSETRVRHRNNQEVLPSGYNAAGRLSTEIKRYLGVRYRYGGADRNGVDCSGLIFRVFINALNLRLPRTAAELAEIGQSISKSQLRFGDLVFFSESAKKVTHVGIYVGKGKFVHASSSSGVIISRLSQRYYRQRYQQSRRVIALR